MSDPPGRGRRRPAVQARDRWLGRILREGAVPELLDVLAERLSPADLQTLLLEVCRRRASTVTPARLLRAYEHNRFTRPSTLDAGELARLEALVQRIRVAAVHRVVRAQTFAAPGMAAHFALLELCTAGRGEGAFAFETTAPAATATTAAPASRSTPPPRTGTTSTELRRLGDSNPGRA